MKPKIVTIKNILRIITSILIIGTMLKSCAKAYTFEDLGRFLDACIDNNITSNSCTLIKLNEYKTLYNKLKNENIDWSQYNTFVFAFNNNNSQQYLFCSTPINWIGSPNNNGVFSLEYYSTPKKYYWYSNNFLSQADIRNGWQIDSDFRFDCGLILGGNKAVLNNNVVVCQYRWDPNDHPAIPPFSFTPNNLIEIDNTYYIKMAYPQEVYLGTLGDNEYYELQIRVKDRYNKIIGTLYDNEYITQTQDNALIRKNNDLYLNSVYLYYYNDYTLNFVVYSDSNTYKEYNYTYQFMPYSAIVENGQIIESGDTTFNGQDLAIYLPQAIAEAVVGIAPSGDNEGTGLLGGILGGISKVFGGIYNTMFKVESGDIYNTLHKIEQTTGITNMDLLSGDIAILNTLTGEPQDFVISWNNIEYEDQIIIPQGNINFSQRIRDNETLTTILNWVHVLMGFSLITIMIQEYWFTLLKMLGIGVSVYEQGEEERARIDEMESTHVYDTVVTTQERDGSEKVRKKYRTYRKRRS